MKGKFNLSRISFRILFGPGLGLLFVSQLLAQQTNPFQGSVPSGAASSTPLALTLDDAIQRGLKFNLGLLQSDVASQTARAERILALSTLLPQVTGTLGETEEQLNLRTLGFNIPPNPYVKIPAIVVRSRIRPRKRMSQRRFWIGARTGLSNPPRRARKRRGSPFRTRAIWSHRPWLARTCR